MLSVFAAISNTTNVIVAGIEGEAGQITRRHLHHPHRMPPDVRAIGKGPQRRTVAGEDDLGVGGEVGGVAAAGERGREELVGVEEEE